MTIRGYLTGGAESQGSTTPLFDIVTYIGNASSRTISTTVDLSTGGMVMIRARSGTGSTYVFDTVRGATKYFITNSTAAETTDANTLTAFGNGSFSLGVSSLINQNSTVYKAYIFKTGTSFLDIVTYTGNGSNPRDISHSLGQRPGFVMIKNVNNTANIIATHNFLSTGTVGFPGLGSSASISFGPGANTITTQHSTGFGCGGAGGWTVSDLSFYCDGGNGRLGGGAGCSDFASQYGGQGGQGAVVIEYGSETVILTSGTTWTVPSGVTSVKVWCIGAGAGSGGNFFIGKGGGAGAVTWKTYSVTPGNPITYTIGASGIFGTTYNGGATSATYDSVTITAPGGSYNGNGGVANATNADGSIAGGNGGSTYNTIYSGYNCYHWGQGGSIGAAHATVSAPVTTGVGLNAPAANDVSGLFSAIEKATTVDREYWLNLNENVLAASGIIDMTSTNIRVNAATTNTNSANYIAYIFGNNAGKDGIIKVGANIMSNQRATFLETGSPIAEPSFLLSKRIRISDYTFSVTMSDYMGGLFSQPAIAAGYTVSNKNRGLTLTDNSSENTVSTSSSISATPFLTTQDSLKHIASQEFLTMSVIIPRSFPTGLAGTDLFQPIAYSGNSTSFRFINTGILTDMVLTRSRSSVSGSFRVADRHRYTSYYRTAGTFSIGSGAGFMTPYSAISGGNPWDSNSGYAVGQGALENLNITGTNYISYAFRKHQGFFDISHFRGTGVNATVSHNLGVAPELMIVTSSPSTNPVVWHSSMSGTQYMMTSSTAGVSSSANIWNSTIPTSSSYYLGVDSSVNEVDSLVVVYLFASLAGISKVGSYTGNGSSQTINCGFSTGARFILIKRLTTTGSWYVWDTARGIISGNDPYLTLNDSAAEVTTNDSIIPDSSGFGVSQNLTTSINENTVSYIYFAIA